MTFAEIHHFLLIQTSLIGLIKQMKATLPLDTKTLAPEEEA
jgi:hypothetical protein